MTKNPPKKCRCLLFLYHALEHPDDGNALEEKLDLNYQPHRSTTSRSGTTTTTTSGGSSGGVKNGGPLGKRYKLIVASNRDEDMDRPTAAMHFWEEGGSSNVLAGEFFLCFLSACFVVYLLQQRPVSRSN